MYNLFRFLRQYSFIFLFLLLEIVSVIFISKNSYYQSSKMELQANAIAGRVYSFFTSFSSYFSLKETNKQLAAENARLRSQVESSYLINSPQVFVKNDTLHQLQYQYAEAKVISNSVTDRNNFIMLNKGRKQGVQPEMAVVSSQGAVGVVTHVSDNFSLVMSLLHSDSKQSIKIQPTLVTGFLIWNGRDYRMGTLEDVPSTHKITVNDTVVTSGFSQDFPQGIPVGYVSKVETNKGTGFYNIKIRYATDFNKLQYVYVITNLFKKEQKDLLGEIQDGQTNKR